MTITRTYFPQKLTATQQRWTHVTVERKIRLRKHTLRNDLPYTGQQKDNNFVKKQVGLMEV